MRPAGGAAGRRGGLEPGAMPADPSSVILLGVLASLGAGLATGVGALPALLLRDISEQVQDMLLGFAAGVMLAASFFSLILPGIEAAEVQGAGEIGAVVIVISGILLGAARLWLISPYPQTGRPPVEERVC